MAEAAGLAASIVALAGLAKTVINFAATVKSIAHDLKTVRTELSRATDSVDFSARLIDAAQSTLRKYCENREAEVSSAVIKFINDEHVMNFMSWESRYIEGHVSRLGEKVESLQDSRTFVVTWKWRHSLKDDFEELRVQIQFIQANFAVLLTTVQLEHIMRREEVDEILIAHLKKTLKQDERVIRRLRKERKVLDMGSDTDSMSSSTESLVLHETVKIILKLAQTVRRDEAVPPANGEDQNVRLRSPSPDRRRRHEERLRVEAIERERAEQQRTPEEERQRAEQMQEYLRRAEALERRLFEQEVENQRREQRLKEYIGSSRLDDRWSPWSAGQPHREGKSLSGSIRPSPTPSHFESPNAPGDGSLSSSIAKDEGRDRSSGGSHNEAVSRQSHGSTPARRPLSWQRILYMTASGSAQKVSGYIGKSGGKQRLVTAILEPEQKFNFMTDKMASDLSLLDSLEPYTDEQDVQTWIKSEGGRWIMPIGKIELQWALMQPPRHAINTFGLQFWVFPYHQERALVLGESFVSKYNDHVRRRRMSEES